MTITPVLSAGLPGVINLLAKANLPVTDIGSHISFFELKVAGQTIGTVGLEDDGSVGLLRSLSVDGAERGQGYGRQLVRFVEKAAADKGLHTLYLLTTTADVFFARDGYAVIQRSEVPPFIAGSTEFSSVCPASAVLMKKSLT